MVEYETGQCNIGCDCTVWWKRYKVNNAGFTRYNHSNYQQKYSLYPLKCEVYNNYAEP